MHLEFTLRSKEDYDILDYFLRWAALSILGVILLILGGYPFHSWEVKIMVVSFSSP